MPKKTETKKPSTDAQTLLLSLEPILAAAVDKARGVTPKKPNGKMSRVEFATRTLAAAAGLENYEPRKRGRPATKSPSE